VATGDCLDGPRRSADLPKWAPRLAPCTGRQHSQDSPERISRPVHLLVHPVRSAGVEPTWVGLWALAPPSGAPCAVLGQFGFLPIGSSPVGSHVWAVGPSWPFLLPRCRRELRQPGFSPLCSLLHPVGSSGLEHFPATSGDRHGRVRPSSVASCASRLLTAPFPRRWIVYDLRASHEALSVVALDRFERPSSCREAGALSAELQCPSLARGDGVGWRRGEHRPSAPFAGLRDRPRRSFACREQDLNLRPLTGLVCPADPYYGVRSAN
jgi:hypothetical protein